MLPQTPTSCRSILLTALVGVLLCTGLAAGWAVQAVSSARANPAALVSAAVPTADLPRARLTPGAVFEGATARIVCVSGYTARVRRVTTAQRALVFGRYRLVHVPNAYEVDHLVALELGGSNAVANLWPEPYAGRWGARAKDRLENRLHQLVCDGDLGLRSAQQAMSRNWPAAYRRYVAPAPPAVTTAPATTAPPTSTTTPAPPLPAEGGYYASSYPTAHLVYCADDAGWRGLSPTYLQHFATLAAALAAFPGRTLHQPC